MESFYNRIFVLFAKLQGQAELILDQKLNEIFTAQTAAVLKEYLDEKYDASIGEFNEFTEEEEYQFLQEDDPLFTLRVEALKQYNKACGLLWEMIKDGLSSKGKEEKRRKKRS